MRLSTYGAQESVTALHYVMLYLTKSVERRVKIGLFCEQMRLWFKTQNRGR